jgi:hypothetical protein
MWFVVAGIGILTTLLMYIYNRVNLARFARDLQGSRDKGVAG